MTPHRSAPGNPSKASEIDLAMLNKVIKDRKVYDEKYDVQSHMFRPTITDMQDMYCGDCYDIYLIERQYKGNHKRGGASFVVAAEGRRPQIVANHHTVGDTAR